MILLKKATIDQIEELYQLTVDVTKGQSWFNWSINDFRKHFYSHRISMSQPREINTWVIYEDTSDIIVGLTILAKVKRVITIELVITIADRSVWESLDQKYDKHSAITAIYDTFDKLKTSGDLGRCYCSTEQSIKAAYSVGYRENGIIENYYADGSSVTIMERILI